MNARSSQDARNPVPACEGMGETAQGESEPKTEAAHFAEQAAEELKQGLPSAWVPAVVAIALEMTAQAEPIGASEPPANPAAGHREGLTMAAAIANQWSEEHHEEGTARHQAIAKELDRLAGYLYRLADQAGEVAALKPFVVASCRRGCGRPVIARGEHCNTRECQQEWLSR